MSFNYNELQNGSDIRGVACTGVKGEDVNLTIDAVKDIASSFGSILKTKLNKKNVCVSVGHDSRITGVDLKEAVAAALTDIGVDVYDFGLASTPSIFMSTVDSDYEIDAGIMITASHLPFNRNGLKFFTSAGGFSHDDIEEILQGANEGNFESSSKKGGVTKVNYLEKYAAGLVQFIQSETGEQQPFLGAKIIVDAGNGAGGFFAHSVIKALGGDITGSVYLEPDGTFPNHIPNPELGYVMEEFSKNVVAAKADFGVIFDTDVDRAAVVAGDGEIISRNRLIALISKIQLNKTPGTTIVTDSVTSTGLTEFIEAAGGIHHRFKRGYKNVIDESIRLNAEGTPSHVAIETSGHCALKDNYFLDDGAYLTAVILCEFARCFKNNIEVSSLIESLKEPYEGDEMRINIKVDDFTSYGQALLSSFSDFVKATDGLELVSPNYEGVRVSSKHGWVLVRLSLHDPVIPINIEADVKGEVARLKDMVLTFLTDYSSSNGDGLDL